MGLMGRGRQCHVSLYALLQCLVHNRLFINIDDGFETLYFTCIKWAVPHIEKQNTTLSLAAIEPKQCSGHGGVTNMSD